MMGRQDGSRWQSGGRILAVLALLLAGVATAAPAPVRLAAAGQALLPVVVGADASPEVLASARELADYLGRISGAEFAVETDTGATGIVVGLPADFTELPVVTDFKAGPFDQEDYVLRSGAG